MYQILPMLAYFPWLIYSCLNQEGAFLESPLTSPSFPLLQKQITSLVCEYFDHGDTHETFLALEELRLNNRSHLVSASHSFHTV